MRRHTIPALALSIVVGAGTAVSAGAEDSGFTASLAGAEAVMIDDADAIAARCVEIDPTAADWVTQLAGEGIARGLGRVTMRAEYCVDADTGAYGDGTFTLTAANGDVLSGVFSGGSSSSVDPEDPWRVDYADRFEFVDGGTGRFATASGTGSETGRFHAETGRWSLEMRGTLTHSRR